MSLSSPSFLCLRVLRLLTVLIGGLAIHTPLKASLIGYWDFDSTSGACCLTVSDQSGNGHDAFLKCCASLSAACGGFNGSGKALCLSTDGANGDYAKIDCAFSGCNDFHTHDFTWSAWVNTTDDDGAIVSMNTTNCWNSGSKAMFLRTQCSKTDVFMDWSWVHYSQAGDATSCPKNYTCVNDGTWHRVDVVFTSACSNNCVFEFYVDGVSQWKTPTPCMCCATDRNSEHEYYRDWNNRTQSANDRLHIGSTSSTFCGTDTLVGKIDDVAAYNEVLTANEIKSSYSAATHACLKYDWGEFDTLKQINDAGSGSATVAGQKWEYVGCLVGCAGVSGTGASMVINIDGNSGVQAVFDYYWDVNGSTAGSSCNTLATGCWTSASNTWSVNCDGSSCSTTWVCGADAYFSAGTNATGTYTVKAETDCMQVGALYFQEGTVTLSANTGARFIEMSDCTPIICVTAANATINLRIKGCNGIIKNGAGTLRLGSGQGSTYSGCTVINAGTILLGANNTLPSGTSVSVAAGATLDVACRTQTIAGISGCGTIDLGTGNLTVGNNNTTSTFNGKFCGSGNLTKTGSGTLTLNGASDATGTFTISAGKITLGVDDAMDDSADIDMDGGTLELASNVQDAIADFSISETSTLTFNTQADFTMSNFTMTAGRTLAITGFVNTTRYSTTLTDGNTFRVDNYPSGIDLNNVTVNGTTAAGLYKFIDGGDGYHYLSLMAPEPSTYIGGAAMVLLLVWHARRRISLKKANRSKGDEPDIA